jgi:putative hemolysin
MEPHSAVSALHPYPLPHSRLPVPEPETRESLYRLGFARGPEELDAVLRLRFDVFNRELGEGLASSWETGRDEDELDRFCHHLLVEETATGRIVGTYRLQTQEMADAGRGFYSATEYDLASIPDEIRRLSLEVGRACIARDHRKRQVLYLLWKGLARYMTLNRKRYLFGCCSLTGQDPALGLRALDQLWQRGAIHPHLWARALPEYRCEAAGPVDMTPLELPQLFETYLRFGGKACSEPALDRRFGTVDFLVLLDTEAMDPRSHRMFFGQ